MHKTHIYSLILIIPLFMFLSACTSKAEVVETKADYTKAVELIHATTDETRPFFTAINASFIPYWHEKTKQTVTIKEGQLKADVVSLGVGLDIDAIQTKGLIKAGWQQRLENNSSPYTTAIAF